MGSIPTTRSKDAGHAGRKESTSMWLVLRKSVFNSLVPGHEGPCAFSWRNPSAIDSRMNGGATGFFQRTTELIPGFLHLRHGPEFHGIIRFGTRDALPTKFLYGTRYEYPENYVGPRVTCGADGRLLVDHAQSDPKTLASFLNSRPEPAEARP